MLDHLDPSTGRARNCLAACGREPDFAAVATMIQGHHKLTACLGVHARRAQTFRHADWNFVSLGQIGIGVPKATRQVLLRAFPNERFHWMLLKPAPASSCAGLGIRYR